MIWLASVDSAGAVEGFYEDYHGKVMWEGQFAETPLKITLLDNFARQAIWATNDEADFPAFECSLFKKAC